MMDPSIGMAKWVSHVNGVNPTDEARYWLTDRISLTVKLISHSKGFKIRRLKQQRMKCLLDEVAAVGLARRVLVRERDVLLCCDGIPVVFAHTIVPLQADASDWPFFSSLGERSLGTTLFDDPQVQRGGLQYARLPLRHPLAERARAAIGGQAWSGRLFARRCLFRRKNGVLLVTEVFLPSIAALLPQAGLPTRFVSSNRKVHSQ